MVSDADKEGFLRSRTSLVQTIGRAARHVEGRVIMYADKMTDSMKFAISETNRRRASQEEYNKKFKINPTSIIKGIREKMMPEEEKDFDYDAIVDSNKLPPKEIKRLIKDIEDKMFIAASNLQFEKAAQLRDQLKELKADLKK